MGTPRRADVGPTWSPGAIVLLLLVPVVLVVGFAATRSLAPEPVTLTLATGTEGGTYAALGELLEAQLPPGGDVAVRARNTAGSVENLRAVRRGEADLALIQSDTGFDDLDEPGASRRIRTVAQLYDEVLHVLVAPRLHGELQGVEDLAGRRLFLGEAGSGTRRLSEAVLGHFGVERGSYEDVELGAVELGEALASGALDCAFHLSAIPSDGVDALLDGGRARLFSFEGPDEHSTAADAIATVFPFYETAVIPARTYGTLPDRTVHSIRVAALMVCDADVAPESVQQLLDTFYAHRFDLLEHSATASFAMHVRERYDPGEVPFPFHPGASAYYNRDEPPFLVRYAEAISLLITVGVGVASGLMAFRQWLKRKRKNAIDTYLLDVNEIAHEIPGASAAELAALSQRLVDIQDAALTDLVHERLEADDSFLIFQGQLRNQLAILEAKAAADG